MGKRPSATEFVQFLLPTVWIKITARIIFRPKIQDVLEAPALFERRMLTGRTDRYADCLG
jgi:hypothetical protein